MVQPFLLTVVSMDVAVADKFSEASDFAMSRSWKTIQLVLLDQDLVFGSVSVKLSKQSG